MKFLLGAVLITLVGSIPSRTSAPSATCDASLWTHVYKPSRLQVVATCITATGVIAESSRDDDGDQHFLIKLDHGQENLLTKKNLTKKYGNLVGEIVCANKVHLKRARAACANYTNQISKPVVGTHVKVTGSYVIDLHNGWAEIHPVSRIEPGG